ncbi:MAG TPA: hypothetical protein PLL09_15810 [Flavobacterium sp.]|uniref:hypothetical protein n=2 Tax=Flavobacterium TaxID=237 RepID=UPI0025C0B22B|nr:MULTISPECIES: hypothetical protein [unclassified Flavobacterium]HRE79282.1 hypothetical protein [Flavobacterium sp.]
MKKNLIVLLSFLTLMSCSTSSVDLSDENYIFTGRGGAKCEVDGVELVPRLTISPGANSLDFGYESYNGEEYLYLKFNNRGPENSLLVVGVVVKNVNPFENNLTGTLYDLNNDSTGTYTIMLLDEFSTNLDYIGEFEIVYHNQQERILAGKFWYDAVNAENEVREIRNGEFDLKY